MTAKDLKNALLQEAVQGKLVPQIATEGNARDLLNEIRKEKSKLIKEGKLKKEKPLSEIKEEEIPFDIPENWCWCRLGEIIDLLSGQDFEPDCYNNKGEGIPYITGASNIENDTVIINRWTTIPKCIALKGDLLLVCKGSGYGTTVFADFEKAHIARQIMSLKSFGKYNCLKYVEIILCTQIKNIKAQGKGVIPGIDRNSVLSIMVSLPPLAEQKRIVAAIEKFMPLIEEYGKKETELKAFNEQIGPLTKKAILQEAVQGKLVPQISAEGNAKDLVASIACSTSFASKTRAKELPPITEDEIPFDIPDNWCWCRLGNVCEIARGGSPRPIKDYLTTSEDGYNWIKIGDTDKNGKYINHTEEKIKKEGLHKTRLVHKGDFLLTNSMSFGRPYILDIEGCIHDGWLVISPSKDIFDKDYLYYLLSSEFAYNQFCDSVSGAVVKNLNSDKVREALFPLPPLAEQKRIVAAIEKLLPLSEKLGA